MFLMQTSKMKISVESLNWNIIKLICRVTYFEQTFIFQPSLFYVRGVFSNWQCKIDGFTSNT